MLTFLEVRFGGNLVQGFRVYAWRAVPSFPQITLCALEMQSDPSPLNSVNGTSLTCIAWKLLYTLFLTLRRSNRSNFQYCTFGVMWLKSTLFLWWWNQCSGCPSAPCRQIGQGQGEFVLSGNDAVVIPAYGLSDKPQAVVLAKLTSAKPRWIE